MLIAGMSVESTDLIILILPSRPAPAIRRSRMGTIDLGHVIIPIFWPIASERRVAGSNASKTGRAVASRVARVVFSSAKWGMKEPAQYSVFPVSTYLSFASWRICGPFRTMSCSVIVGSLARGSSLSVYTIPVTLSTGTPDALLYRLS